MTLKAKAKLAPKGPSPQRVSPFLTPLLLQSPPSRIRLVPQVTA
jgi:hypothetical protein